MSALPKPILRGHLRKKGLKMLVGAVTSGVVGAALYKFLVAVPRKNAYNEFLKTYDAEQHYNELIKYGYLQSAKMAKEN